MVTTPENIKITVFHNYAFWILAVQAAHRSKTAKLCRPDLGTPDTVPAILLAAVSCEAFINEIGASLSTLAYRKNPKDIGLQKWISLGNRMEQLEKDKKNTELKYLITSQCLPGKPLVKGQSPYQDFQQLMKMRNDFVHPKAQASQRLPKYFTDFSQKGWLFSDNENLAINNLVGWMYQFQTPEIAVWACKTAQTVILHLLKQFENIEHPDMKWSKDLAYQWKESLNDNRLK